MRVALDTNIMAYAEGLGDEARCRSALTLVARLPVERVVVPVQTLGELYRILTGKAGRPPAEVREAILGWIDSFEVVDSTREAFQAAMDLAIDHKLQFWDSLILAVAAENRCRLLLSEDLQDGFTWHGVTVVDPFRQKPNALLPVVLEAPDSE